MIAIKKMRLPLSAEYTRLAELVHESDAWMNWSTALSWCEDEDPIHHALREARGGAACKNQAFIPDDTRAETVGFRPAFEAETDIPDGQIVIVGTLFMEGTPVKVPVCLKDTAKYIPGAKLEMRPALEDENFQVRAIRAGSVLVADRVLLKNISWDDIQDALATPAQKVEIKSVRLPTSREWDQLIDATLGVNSVVHWKGAFSWCLDKDLSHPGRYIARGMYAGSCAEGFSPKLWDPAGFRPAFIIENSEEFREGETVVVGTLYMNGQPVPVDHDGARNVPDYIPGATLEFREPVGNPKYQVKTIKAGSVLIADRVLLKTISWTALAKLGFCGDAHNRIITSKREASKENDEVIFFYVEDAEHGLFALACSKENEKEAHKLLARQCLRWTKDGVGSSLWGKLRKTIEAMRELLEDKNLELVEAGDEAAILLEEEVYGPCAVICSKGNKERVQAFLTKRYPKWVAECVGNSDSPWNYVLDAVKDMKELLGDERLRFLDSCEFIRVPSQP